MYIYIYIYIYIYMMYMYIYVYNEVTKTIECTHPPHHHNGFVVTCQLWTATGRP